MIIKTLKIFSLIIFITIFIVIIFSCSEREVNMNCVFSEDVISSNFKVIYMSTRIKDGEYPERGVGDLEIYYNSYSLQSLNNNEFLSYCRENVENGYFTEKFCDELEFSYDYDKSPITFWIEIEKNKNSEIEEEIYKKMFHRRQNSDKIDSLVANVWATDKNCKDYQKISVPFYKYKETENSYILTTQLIENDEFIAGRPVFLTNEKAYYANTGTRSYDLNNIILLPVDSKGRTFMDVYNKSPLNIKVNVEINLTKHENGSYVEYKDTLNTILWDCQIMWSEEDW